MSDLTPEDRALIDRARDDAAPTAADRARVQRRLAAQLGAAAVGLTTTTTATTAAASSWVGISAAKVVVALGIVTAGAAVVYTTSRPSHTPLVAPSSAVGIASRPQPSRPESTIPAPPATSSEPPAIPSTTPIVAPLRPAEKSLRPTASASTSTSTLDEELALLAQADASLRRGDATKALTQLDEHARRFPKSSVKEERDVERVLALCAAGRSPEARREADAILKAHPSSPYTARLRASCVFR